MIVAARLLSFLTGFLSLSQEILWMRIVSFAYAGAPQAFGLVLAIYLAGIGVGAAIGKLFCQGRTDLFKVSGYVLLIAGVFDLLLPWATAHAMGYGRLPGTATLAVSVFLTSMGKSIIFPIAHHLGSSQSQSSVGSSVSKVYFANIAGSTLGPLLTGFVLLQIMTLEQCLTVMAGLTFLVALACLWQANGRVLQMQPLIVALISMSIPALVSGQLVRTLARNTGNGEGGIKQVVENRYGIIHVVNAPKGGDAVFGGNAYDGRINIDLVNDSNGIARVYALAALKPDAKRILNIGMSSGAWTRVLAAFPALERFDVIEINPGYSAVAKTYPPIAPIFDDPKVMIHYDDGRRWLKRHPLESYDLIVMNTTWHWRGYATLLLSQDFIAEIKQHMLKGAVLAYNSTGSPEVLKTASTMFRQVYLQDNFVVAGDDIVMPNHSDAQPRIAAVQRRIDPALAVSVTRPPIMTEYWSRAFIPFAEVEKTSNRALEVITDQNMLTEFKHGRSVLGYLNKKQ